MNLPALQHAVKEGWTDEGYSAEFRGRNSPYKHFDHALKHIRKAAQALENMTEFSDHHADDMAPLSKQEISKYVADIVICAARLANVAPGLSIDLDLAVIQRVKDKILPKVEGGKGA